MQNELKNQRMKADLISNVSHDLKTPLTSIITYIDLLKQEGLDSLAAPKYLEILDQKSIRLKKLTEDLFDAAKASSGAIPVRFEKVDMLSLVNQGLGEMSDRIETSNLEFKINAQKEKYYIHADGQLLWRVVENLLGNVLKYAQEGSRVYIDLYEQNSKLVKSPNVVLEIKNISKMELNIDADELMERFKRGDESRTTEGSGLGLAIAKDLVRLQNGRFEIKIDGDLFKAIVMLESYTAGNKEEEQPFFP
ncbi:MAG: Alkaline phosphatase synthesis sensor protein PhoR [Pelotomaculum sp. PtaU1.Bin035]|nr:MAG: Alkaline phosphatase synthesis sensor protein PhoR [Pelotomaculum sp. PtaU1.Bin035]